MGISMEALIREKVACGNRITRDEANWLFQMGSHALVSELAMMVKSRFHKPDEASYLIMAIINYTNVCVAKCDYCSFYRLPHQLGTYHLSFSQVCEKIDALKELGGTLIGFNGGFHPKLSIYDFVAFFADIRARYPELTFYEMTVAEFMFYCKRARISYAQGAKLFKDSGTNWITGGGAEILTDSFRMRHSPGKYKTNDYYAAQKAILDAGMGSTATMVIGFDESLEERFDHLQMLRDFQDQQERRLTSFLCWTYKPWHNILGGEEIKQDEYLKWLGICRIFLDNFKHIRASVLTQNQNAMSALLYGSDDFDLPTEDEVTQKAGATISLEFAKILEHAHALGFKTTHRKPWILSGSPLGSDGKHLHGKENTKQDSFTYFN